MKTAALRYGLLRLLSIGGGARQSRALALEAPPAPSRKKKQPIIGIRRETINAWERRAPLAPTQVKRLVDKGITVLIQPSNRRAYPIQAYQAAGALPVDDLSDADVIMSVKTVPIEDLIPNKVYVFFSHTIKAQRENMPLLDAILAKNITLIDYERIVTDNNKRLVMFGKWAGYAGIIDVLHGLGLRLLALGHHTPFLHIGLAHNYRDSHMAVNALRDCGYEIALGLMPASLGPLIFTFTGSGNVSAGAQELLRHLPHEYVDVETLPQVSTRGKLNRVYICEVNKADHLKRIEGGQFDAAEFEEFPQRYKSAFAEKIAPYTSVFINGIYWAPGHPRLITIPDAKRLLTPAVKLQADAPGQPTLPHRMIAICDISADPGGSIEFMNECTTIDKPFVIYDANQHKSAADTFDTPSGVLVCSVDNMPAQMPTEATSYFGSLLLPYIDEIIKTRAGVEFDQQKCNETIKRAIITNGGKLTRNYEYIADLRKQQQVSASKTRSVASAGAHRVLLLGAGMVSGPIVDYFGKQQGTAVTASSAIQEDLDRIASIESHVTPVVCDIQSDSATLDALVKEHDVVISMLPYALHPMVAKACIKHRKNMVTSSYLLPAMQELHDAARDAGISVMNEVGLDPGIDHMMAMECIDNAHVAGAKVTHFISYCGGLPAPEWSDNPLRYKFSWSPKGALLALLNPAKYLRDGQLIKVPEGQVIDHVEKMTFMPGFNLVGYPNRDSTVFASAYGIERDCQTLLRGTLRYEGFVESVRALLELGLLSTQSDPLLQPNVGPDLTWKEYIAQKLNRRPDIFPDSLRQVAAERLGRDRSREIEALNNLGLFRDGSPMPKQGTPLDSLAAHLSRELAYAPHERDIVILHHHVRTRQPNGQAFSHDIDLVAYGDPKGYSAMARTVGYTAAIAANMMLTGEIQKTGMLRPLDRVFYRTALHRLEQLGITYTVRVKEIEP